MTTTDFYPDAHPESTCVDGNASRTATESWASIRTGAGTSKDDSTTTTSLVLAATTTSPNYTSLYRGALFFNTGATLPDDAVITAATLTLNITSKVNTGLAWTSAHAGLAICANTGTGTTALANSDYENVGATRLATDIAYDSVGVGDNVFTLNAAGLAYITNNGRTGLTRLAVRFAVDLDAGAPTFTASKIVFYTVNYADKGSLQPKLSVTWHQATTRAYGMIIG